MSKISIKLNENYKSFKKDFEDELEGDLIVLTGVNGSGKSQLLEVIARVPLPSGGQPNVEISLNNVKLNKENILFRSFKDFVNINPLIPVNPNYIQIITSELFNARNYSNTSGFTKSIAKFETLSGKKLYEFDSQDSIESELNSDKFANYVFEYDNIFTYNNLSNIFLSYLHKQQYYCRQNVENYKNLDEEFQNANPRPWIFLNKLFKKFNFDYKFADDYNISPNGTILGGVNLLDKNNNSLPFGIDSLSDGEKTIFSLVIASMKAEINGVLPRILLLDEYDATFNPSLTEVFYYILEEFFVKKGVTVILTTHNPATVAFAPKSKGYKTSFYEINKPNSGKKRIEPKEWEEIEEAKMVLRKFYPQVGEYEKEIEELRNQNLPILFVEGKTDKIILENAWAKLYPNEKMPVSIRDGQGCDSMKALIRQRESLNPLKIFWIFDYDDEGFKVQNESFHCGKKDSKFEIIQNYQLDIKKDISNEFYLMLLPLVKFDNKNYASTSSKNKHQTIEHLFEKQLWGKLGEQNEVVPGHKFWYMPKGQKNKFAESTKDFSPESFQNFKPIFDTIKEILKTSKSE